MRSIKKVKEEIINISQIKSIVEVFEEISAIRMKDIRDEILGSRDFLERLANLSNEVGSDLSSIDGNSKSASIYLSSSGGMYGELPEKVFNAFLEHTKNNKTEIFIFGKQGKDYISKYRPNLKFNYYELDDRKKSSELVAESLKVLSYFGQITVFYGKFKNLVNQESRTQSIMGNYEDKFNKISKKDLEEKRFKHIYEPSVNDVSKKFATEIKTSVFEGMIKENDLAKTASRLMHLDKAFESINQKLAILEITKNRENKKMEDKKQQERIKRIWL